MRLALSNIVQAEQESGNHLLAIKSELFNLKQEGDLFFSADLASMTENEDIDLYYSGFPGSDSDRGAFPVLNETCIVPKDEDERFLFFKKHYEAYYPDSEMDMNEFRKFSSTPFRAKKCTWFSRNEG